MATGFKKIALISTLLIGLSNAGQADGIELKGFKLGMNDEETTMKLFGKKNCRGAKNLISSIWGKCSDYFFGTMTLAGQEIYKPTIIWDNKKSKKRKVEAIIWRLDYDMLNDPAQFDLIKEAIKSKYPGLKCEPYLVNNAFGAIWDNEQCLLEKDGTNLLMRKYKQDLTKGFVQLYYKDKTEQEDQEYWNESKKDI